MERIKKQDRIKRTSDDYEKEGLFIGAYCKNPLTGWKMPIFAGNFVLMEYGTGAVMAVPTHDQRDFYFAKKFNLPLVVVIQPEGKPSLNAETMTEAFTEDGVLANSGPFTGMSSDQAREAIAQHLEEKGLGKKAIHTASGTGGFPGNGTGALPSRLFIARSMERSPFRKKTFPLFFPMM